MTRSVRTSDNAGHLFPPAEERIAALEAQLAEKDRENRLIHDTMQAAIFDKVRLTAQLAEERGRIAGDQARLFHTEGACSDLMKENVRLTAQVEKARVILHDAIVWRLPSASAAQIRDWLAALTPSDKGASAWRPISERIEAAARAISWDYAEGDWLDEDERQEVRDRATRTLHAAFPEFVPAPPQTSTEDG